MDRIKISKSAAKDLKLLPDYIKEALKGKREGQRSIRLNRSYRIIYTLKYEHIYILKILEINKHDY